MRKAKAIDGKKSVARSTKSVSAFEVQGQWLTQLFSAGKFSVVPSWAPRQAKGGKQQSDEVVLAF